MKDLTKAHTAACDLSKMLWVESQQCQEQVQVLSEATREADARQTLTTPAAARRRRRQEESSSDSDFEDEWGKRGDGRNCRGRTVAASFARRKKRGRGASSPGHPALAGQGEEWEDEEVEAAQQEVLQQWAELEALEESIDQDKVSEGLAVLKQAEEMVAALRAKEAEVQRLGERRAELQATRYARFATAMDVAETRLSAIYQVLTGGLGDANCAFPRDAVAAFEQGVRFRVRPDATAWRPFATLSGGQQALAALALCLALQDAAPAPFYFFDEIDAALDSVNAARVADFLAAASGARSLARRCLPHGAPTADEDAITTPLHLAPQFLVVSHKEHVGAVCDSLVGVAAAAAGAGAQAACLSCQEDEDGGSLVVQFGG